MDLTQKEFLTAEEVAQLLSLSYNQVLNLANEGRIPAVRVGERPVRFSAEALKDWFYFGSLCGQKQIMEHIGVDHDTMMHWIKEFKNYQDKSELELVRAAKASLEEMRRAYINGSSPTPEVIKTMEAALNKIQVFDPDQALETRRKKKPA